MLALRSPALALALLGACLGACFTDAGTPALSTAPGTTDPSTGATDVEPGTSATDASSTSTTAVTTADATTTSTTTSTTGDLTTAEATTTGCVKTVWYFDIDKDGHGGQQSTESCGPPGPGYTVDSTDCNDAVPEINPDADEVCDQLDNDCDGGVDEYPAGSMVTCNGCRSVLDDDSTYYFCAAPERSWDEARAHCATLLGDLAIVTSKLENNFIRDQLGGNKLGVDWWIGLNDSASEDEFLWVDGSPLDPLIAFWANGEPNNGDSEQPGPAHCVIMLEDIIYPGLWRDQVCATPKASICEAPLF